MTSRFNNQAFRPDVFGMNATVLYVEKDLRRGREHERIESGNLPLNQIVVLGKCHTD